MPLEHACLFGDMNYIPKSGKIAIQLLNVANKTTEYNYLNVNQKLYGLRCPQFFPKVVRENL